MPSNADARWPRGATDRPMSDSSLSSLFLASSADRPPLRVGILVDSARLSNATASIIRDLQSSDFVRIELVVFNASAAPSAPHRRGLRLGLDLLRRRQTWGRAAFALYAWIDKLRVGLTDDPIASADCSSSLDDIDSMWVTPIAQDDGHRFPQESLERIDAAKLDVLLQFGFGTLRGAILWAARYGVWMLRHGDDAQFRDGPPGFWEMVEGGSVTGVMLVRVTEDGTGALVLDRAFFPTDATSIARTRHRAQYGSTHLVIRRLQHLHQWGWPWLMDRLPPPLSDGRPRTIDTLPTNREVIAWLLPLALRRVVARVTRALTRRDDVLHWRIAIRIGHRGLTLNGQPDMAGFTWVEAPRGHFYADPFVVRRDGRHWVFLEDFSYAAGAGVIGCGEVTPNGDFVYSGPVLTSAGHLSYPMVVVDGGDALMVPESAEEGAVRVYRATDFPQGWELVAEPYRGGAVDTTAWRQDGRWWFFTTVREPRGRADLLLLFHADRIDGTWIPHPMNPISQDVRSARGAGGLFLDDEGRLVRPSQDGSRGYGHRFTLNEITALSDTDYAERPRLSVDPDWDPALLGTHTYNRAGDVEMTDGKVSRSRRSVT